MPCFNIAFFRVRRPMRRLAAHLVYLKARQCACFKSASRCERRDQKCVEDKTSKKNTREAIFKALTFALSTYC